QFPVYFVPAGYVFSIWSLIYVALIAFAVYQALPRNRMRSLIITSRIIFMVSCFANIVWILLWHYGYITLTILVMIVLLFSLLIIYTRVQRISHIISVSDRWCVQKPFSLYLGWVTVATISNMSVVLYVLGWQGGWLAPQIWSATMIIVATIISALVIIPRKDWVYGLVIVWALIGIAVKFSSIPIIRNMSFAMVGVHVILLGWIAWNQKPILASTIVPSAQKRNIHGRKKKIKKTTRKKKVTV
ncbi:MAG TPA: tryptophan-rich sensory protein, partial [Patescibacteria group bacterium]|nr:tryptophan-rich sensory protein [Patescibacteria group bacterium]